MSVVRRASRGRLLALAIVVVLAAGLLWGIGGAVAADESASPAAGGKTILRLGWTNDPDNLNPFIGYESSSYEIWAINYELLVGFQASDYANVPGVGLATDWQTSDDDKVWTFTITDKSKWQDGTPLTAKDVAFTFNYVIDNELGMFLDYVKFIDKVEATDDTTVVFTCSKPKANMLGLWIPILPEHIWSKVKPVGGREQVQEPAAHRRLGALPDRGVEEGRVRAHGRQQGLLARRSQGRRGHLPDLSEPGHDGAGSQDRRHPERLEHPLGAGRRAEQRARPRGDPRRRRGCR